LTEVKGVERKYSVKKGKKEKPGLTLCLCSGVDPFSADVNASRGKRKRDQNLLGQGLMERKKKKKPKGGQSTRFHMHSCWLFQDCCLGEIH